MEKMYLSQLKAELKSRNISHKELADSIGVTPGAISLIITGKRKPYPQNIRKIADFLGMASGTDDKGTYFYEVDLSDKRNKWLDKINKLSDENKRSLDDYADYLLTKQKGEQRWKG